MKKPYSLNKLLCFFFGHKLKREKLSNSVYKSHQKCVRCQCFSIIGLKDYPHLPVKNTSSTYSDIEMFYQNQKGKPPHPHF